MKKALLLCLTLIAATFGFAQQPLATLNHNDSIRVYYGASALQHAHAAAVNGDIITLSPGSFQSVNITKAVTIRGAGMFPDTISNTAPTTLIGDFTITVANDSLHNLTMEGFYCSGEYVKYVLAYNPQFIKCYFRIISHNASDSRMYNAFFVNCIINNFSNNYSYSSSSTTAQNTTFLNSVILDMSEIRGTTILTNCIARIEPNPEKLNVASINNSIIYHNNQQWSGSVNAYSTYYSLGLYTGNDNRYYFNYSGLANHYIYNYRGFASVFKNFRGTYDEGISFELLDSVAATCLGYDGTQVGIYGGIMPFDPRVSGLNIRRLDVARRTTADGRLAVDIEVVNEESTNTTEEE